MRYYVISDPHGYFTLMKNALTQKGYFDDSQPHKLVILGDLMDRGEEAVEMQTFICEQMEQKKLIFIRGNHEDLMMDMICNYSQYRWDILRGWPCHHVMNGTFDTALQLTGYTKYDALTFGKAFVDEIMGKPFIQTLIPRSKNYFETKNYIFVHGWIPCFPEKNRLPDNWRRAGKKAWMKARWHNGMEMAEQHKFTIPGKTILCGHWHTSYGHSVWEKHGSEFGEDADFSIYYGNGVIGLDACTAYSNMINCLLIEDEEKERKEPEK